jgi:hypothetical protein
MGREVHRVVKVPLPARFSLLDFFVVFVGAVLNTYPRANFLFRSPWTARSLGSMMAGILYRGNPMRSFEPKRKRKPRATACPGRIPTGPG